jgi:hypothetical protein
MPGTAAELNLPLAARASFTNSATVLIFIEAGTPTPRMVDEKRAAGISSLGS